MSTILDSLSRDTFDPLPTPDTADGAPRRVGVEIEFGNLDEGKAAALARDILGGELAQNDAHDYTLTGSEIGEVQIYLDTALRKKADGKLADMALEGARAVVPVEIVTAPLKPSELPRLTKLNEALVNAGAQGSDGSLFYGFGVHFNPEVADPSAAHILPVLQAFALLEPWLRSADPIDPSRRLLPFTDSYPTGLVDALSKAEGWSMDRVIDLYLDLTPSRNRGLDMLPLFMSLDEARVAPALPAETAVSARPTYHYRLPDCRIGSADWSLAYEWNKWVLVERVAADASLLAELCAKWQDHQAHILEGSEAWAKTVEQTLAPMLEGAQ